MALNAAKIVHCKNDGDSKIIHFLYKNQTLWAKENTVEKANSNLKKLLSNNGYSLNFDECINNKEIENHILEDRIEGTKKYKVNATPTLIINEKKFDKSLNYKNLKKIIEKNL
jgi:protein-disulfide isomerase